MKLTAEGCRARQRRLVEVLENTGLGGAIIAQRKHVYYFTGFLHPDIQAGAAMILRDGQATVVGAGVPDDLGVDEVIAYKPDAFCTMHTYQHERVAEALDPAVPSGAALGTDAGGGAGAFIALAGADAYDLSDDIRRLRKSKHPDEVDAIRETIGLCNIMYATAKATVEPGADEVDVFAAMQAACIRQAGCHLERFGNDFQANSIGGPPRRRQMNAGELYILDAGPRLDGYSADNCRTFAVDGEPTDAQMCAWKKLDALFPMLEAEIKPGMKAVRLYEIANAYLNEDGYDGLIHHLGHGYGLDAHESPELNPEYDSIIEAGDIITMEPGLYGDELKHGMRLEENYLIKEEGIEKLTPFPRTLT